MANHDKLNSLTCSKCGKEVRVGDKIVSVLCSLCTNESLNDRVHEAVEVKTGQTAERREAVEAACSKLPPRLAALRRNMAFKN